MTAALAIAGGPAPPPRFAALRAFRDPGTGEALDRGLLLLFPAPASLTGEDVAELHHHGGPAVLAALAAALGRLRGVRPAEPGEFARRAFLRGKLDLTRAEALADLVEAETAAQRRQALRQLDGALGRQVEAWREALLGALARIEAEIDFGAEEADVGDDQMGAARAPLAAARDGMAAALAAAPAAARLREGGVVVAILGPPNAGKSTLLNRLAGRDAAIVAAAPGTTRDPIEVRLELAGAPVTLVDTAGLRATDDPVEREGVARARAAAARADATLLLLAADLAPDPGALGLAGPADLVAVNKVDLGPVPPLPPGLGPAARGISLLTGEGLPGLVAALEARVAALALPGSEAPLTRERHRAALAEASESLDRALGAGPGAELALVAEDLRLAARALGRITGRVDVEEVLDRIFAGFCIGK